MSDEQHQNQDSLRVHPMKSMKKSYVRITSLLWADILVAYALFVMQNYLTKVWNLSFTHAAAILNIWGGISMILPIFFLFLVDAFLGHLNMLLISSLAYTTGIGLVTMSTPPVLGPCDKYEQRCIGGKQEVMLYTGMVLIAIGVAANYVSVKPLLDQQGEEDSSVVINCLKVPAYCLIVIVPIVGAIALPYIKPWVLRFGIPAICTLVATLLFLTGVCTYDSNKPQGSPLTTLFRVFLAAASKITQSLREAQFHGGDDASFTPTRCLRLLEKAAIIPPETNPEETSRWKLCTVTEVESMKTVLRMVPMCFTFVVCGIVASIGNTYFIEQASKMNRKIGTLRVPLQILLLFQQCTKKYIFDNLADRVLKRHHTFGSRIAIALAMMLSILCCITAAVVEIFRLKRIREHGLADKPNNVIPMSVFVLLFQFSLLAGLDSFFEKSVGAFFHTQSPESMKSYLRCFSRGVYGLGYMCSVASVFVVGLVSKKAGGKNWFQATLNKSHLDRYYWVLAGLSSVNLVTYLVVVSFYTYRETAYAPEDNGGVEAPIASGEVDERQVFYGALT